MTYHVDTTYLDLVRDILENGERVQNRTGVETLSVFIRQLRFDLRAGFPLLTTKKINISSVATELLWFLRGDTNIHYLLKNNVHIWSEWPHKAYQESVYQEFGPLTLKDFESKILEEGEEGWFTRKYGSIGAGGYGRQWRDWIGDGCSVDQIAKVVERIKTHPTCRRLVVSAWNPAEIDRAVLPPCHLLFMFKVTHGGTRLNCQLIMRSCDLGLGLPYNIASYALLTHMIAQVCGLEVGELGVSMNDAHIYVNHQEPLKAQLEREPFSMPRLLLNPEVKNIDDFKIEDVKLEGYQHHPFIKMEVAV